MTLSKKITQNILQIMLLMVCSFMYAQKEKPTSYYYKSAIHFGNLNKTDSAYFLMKKAKDGYKVLKDNDSIFLCNLKLFDIVGWQENLNKDRLHYLTENEEISTKDKLLLIGLNNRFGVYFFNQNSPEKSASYFHKSIYLTTKIKRPDYKSNVFINLGLLYSKKYQDSANVYLNKALNIIPKENTNKIASVYINLINLYQNQSKFTKAIELLKKTDQLILNEGKLKYKKIIYRKFSECYQRLQDYKKAFQYQSKYITYKDSLDVFNQNKAIKELDEKYKVAEKDKENLELRQKNLLTEQKRKQTQNFLFGSLILLFFGGTIAYLNLKNSRKKRLLAEQQKELEKQKNLTLLKEQEITTINAMVEGQEKERIRIAEDLHDNIGSVLATLKLHFENLKLNREKKHFNQEELYNKTEKLIDETYLKVRSIAHAKNAGVIANQGLLVAIKMMAEKISSANQLNIEIVDFGLDRRLDSNTEITIFRIIQELITNIIKHAEASEATINISHFDDNLNIIIEDNGKGFNPSIIPYNNGMGLGSIKKRVEYLHGNFQIDSAIKRGTSIIINIPL
ncbi:hypothetical protein EV195_10385 [Tenacibaculum skagerrakense]|uniref:Oxygen sensor histidine kinase NreB n=1 Tax=Tenacibaculum skagerrakense TaxID=186571 RepID=A0A4V2SM27_9FLAO|nr:sensor histidine kinase [Tenacibaculum skagerrakense]TCP25726.1 hypothetical protein EV195_10385 [Tenacibaculum skagerrakense]